MTNEQLAERLRSQAKFNDALDETCRILMDAAAERLLRTDKAKESLRVWSERAGTYNEGTLVVELSRALGCVEFIER